ncbi:EF hand [Sulfitobacter sp. THAF37]|uniref:hypothetical protein n=1 Tax=Sulfitobacter sp. THAF37 TaxID=2587855 RepID=UPI0012A7C450|nr:hypothetical protein [Sulfitobacter sp. THAF37]QFT59713.1 EF hand [Sulfitobacter sp. THAF37]
MTKTTKFTFAALTALCMPAYAMATGVAEMDTNGDGLLSVTEVQAVYPDITAEQFSAMDLNADGALDKAELVSAQEAGMMPASEEG